MGVVYGFTALVGEAVAYGHGAVERHGVALAQSHDHGDCLHHRAGFVGEDGAVHGLDVPALMQGVALQVGDGLDVACSHFHNHGGAPVGVALDEHLAELALKDVLHGDVDGGGDGVAVLRLLDGPLGNTAGEEYALGASGLAVEQGVERLFQPADAVLAVFLAGNVAHASHAQARHVAVGIHAAQHRLYLQPRAVGVARAAEEGEGLDALGQVVGHVAGQTEGAFALRLGHCQRLGEIVFPLLAGARGEVDGEGVGQGVEALHVLAYPEALGAEVDADVVVVEVGGEDGAVAGEDVAAQGLYGRDGVELPLSLGVPCLGVDDRGVDEHEHYRRRHQGDAQDDDTEIKDDARAAVAAALCLFIAHGQGRF